LGWLFDPSVPALDKLLAIALPPSATHDISNDLSLESSGQVGCSLLALLLSFVSLSALANVRPSQEKVIVIKRSSFYPSPPTHTPLHEFLSLIVSYSSPRYAPFTSWHGRRLLGLASVK
jgi:hypothetical protein